jgi:hypothetical protein
MTRTFAAVILVGWLCGVPNATAQEKRPYVGGGFMVVPWGGAQSLPGGPSTSFTNTGPEAVNTGLVAEAGWFLTENVTAGVEVAFPFQRNPVTQSHGYFDGSYRLVGRYRETTTFVMFRALAPAYERVRVAAVGGGGFLWGDLLQRTARTPPGRSLGPLGPFGPEEHTVLSALATTFGGEVEILATSQIRIVPQVRVSLIGRGPVSGVTRSGMASFGFDKVGIHAAVTVRRIF